MAAGTAAIVGGTLLGAIAGSQSSGGGTTRTQQESISRVDVAPEGAQEAAARQQQDVRFRELAGLVNLGPGASAVQQSQGATEDLARMLQQYAQGGFAPTEADQALARQQMAPQWQQLEQYGTQARQQRAQQAALLGRGGMDFTFQNRLRQDLGQMQQQLAAQQASLATQLPGQRLGYAGQLADLRAGLAQQAFQNRQAIMGLGSQIQSAERNWRLATATRTGQTSGSQTMPETGGGLQGAIMGGFMGAGAGLQAAPALGQLFSTKPTQFEYSAPPTRVNLGRMQAE